MELKKRVVSGFFWTAAERFGSLLIHTCAAFVLLRVLTPNDFGILGLVTVFMVLANTIIDSGFSQALIQKKNATEADYNSIFWLNMGLGIFLYFLSWGLSYPVASYYGIPEISQIAPWLFLSMPLSALSFTQTTKLTRSMDFRTLSTVNFTASLASATIAVVCAFAGAGLWALVAQSISLYVFRTGMLWIRSSWRPALEFSFESVRGLYHFGSRLFVAGFITHLFNNISVLIIGKAYNTVQAGLYSQPLKLKDSIATGITYSVQNVTFPAFSSLQDNSEKLNISARKVVSLVCFVLFPVMAGLVAVASEAFFIAGEEKWVPAVPYFRVFCLSAFFLPLSTISLNLLKATGQGNTILKLEFLKKGFALAAIIFASGISVLALSWAYFAWMFFEMAVNFALCSRTIGYRLRDALADTIPYLLLTAIMFVVVWVTGAFMAGANPVTIFLAKIAAGIITYTALCLIIKPEAWLEAIDLYKGLRNRKTE